MGRWLMWLYMPYTSAQDTEGSSLPSDTPESTPEPYVTLSGTPTQRPLSWPGWKNRPWIGRLYGTISSPSMAQRGADEWISSLPVFHASRSRRQDSNVELTMTAGSGLTSPGSLLTWDPDTSSWRTSPDLFGTVSLTSSPTLPASGSMRSGVVSARQPLARRTSGNGSGCWPTPVARDDQKSPEAHLATKARMGGGRTAITSLTVMAKQWPSPTARDGKGKPGQNAQFQNLTTSAVNWSTPTASMMQRGDCPSQQERRTPGLPIEASRLHQTISTDGDNGSKPAGLNPLFVETLMGLPIGWTDPVRSLTDYTSPGTASYHNAPPKRFDNSSNGACHVR